MSGRKERLARALEKGGVAINDMAERIAGIESTQGEILALLRTVHSELGSHRDHAIELLSQQGKRIGDLRKDLSAAQKRLDALDGVGGPAE